MVVFTHFIKNPAADETRLRDFLAIGYFFFGVFFSVDFEVDLVVDVFEAAGFLAAGFFSAGFLVAAVFFSAGAFLLATVFLAALFPAALLTDFGKGSVFKSVEAATSSAGTAGRFLAASRQFGKNSSIRWREMELARRQRGQCAS